MVSPGAVLPVSSHQHSRTPENASDRKQVTRSKNVSDLRVFSVSHGIQGLSLVVLLGIGCCRQVAFNVNAQIPIVVMLLAYLLVN